MQDVHQILADVRRGELDLDCVFMSLVRKRDGKQFTGPGYIRQKRSRDFELKIYAGGRLNLHDVFSEWGATQAGVLFVEGDYYELTARDGHGRRWTASRVRNPSVGGNVEESGFIVESECQEITLLETRPTGDSNNWIELRSIDEMQFPRTARTRKTIVVGESRTAREGRLNAAEFTSNGLTFCIEDDEGMRLFASAKSAPLPPRIKERITEAVTFSLGAIPRWTMSRHSEGKEVITRFRHHETASTSKAQWPPLKIEIVDDTGSIWRMFDLYLAHVLKDSMHVVHKLSRNIFGICMTRDSSAEGQALAVAVAVESVLDQFYSDLGKPSEAYVAEVHELIANLKACGRDVKLVDRAIGSIAGLARGRADDRLRELVAGSVIGEAGRRAWKRLRNTAAHGSWHAYDDKLQELLDLTGAVAVLFNQLIFHLIGYAGKQTDYGTHDWPTFDYPPRILASTDTD